MRIAQVVALAEAVPPKLYGSTERAVCWFTEELIKFGHDVTLFARGHSITNADLAAPTPTAIRLARESVAEKAYESDLVHLRIDGIHLRLSNCLQKPLLTILHGRVELADLPSARRGLSADAGEGSCAACAKRAAGFGQAARDRTG